MSVIRCKGCGGTSYQDPPMGWLQLSVNVPRDMGKFGKPYLWAGVYCSVYCLASDISSLARQEEAAHSLFTPDRAEHLAGLS